MATLTILSIPCFAQQGTVASTKQKSAKVQYTCPMHPEVMMDEVGKCPKCGMDLTKSTKEQMKMDEMKMYTCPSHADVVSNTTGKCPKCGNSLNLSTKEQMKMTALYVGVQTPRFIFCMSLDESKKKQQKGSHSFFLFR